MKNRMMELYRSLAKHFSQLCTIPVTVVDSAERSILLTHKGDAVYYCDQCPNRCQHLQTMLYGCNEARRWKGRYIFYCPIGLVLSAVNVPETDQTVVAGPLITGEVQDTVFDLPDYIDPESVLPLFQCSADTLNHISSGRNTERGSPQRGRRTDTQCYKPPFAVCLHASSGSICADQEQSGAASAAARKGSSQSVRRGVI